MKDEKEQAELEAILEEASKHKPASKGKASAVKDVTPQEIDAALDALGEKVPFKGSWAKVELHYVAQCMHNFADNHPEMCKLALSVFKDVDFSDDNLQAVLENDLPPELNHFIRWLLKIPFAERTEWQR